MPDIHVVVDEEMFKASRGAQKRKLREYAERLIEEPFLGDRIQKRLFPKRYGNLPSLFRLELPGGWRALYAVASSPTHGAQVRIIWIGNHSEYDRLFGY